MKLYLAVVVVVVAIVGSALGVHYYTSREHNPVCVAGPNELCPNAYFSHRVHELQEAQKESEHLRMNGTLEDYEDKTAYIIGLSNQLFAQASQGGMTPNGYQWDMEKWKFVKQGASNVPTVANPVPGPPAGAKP
jgi:hypothetical protein